MIYGDPGTIVPLNIPAGQGDVQLSVPPGLIVARRVAKHGFRAESAVWSYAAGVTHAVSSGAALPGPMAIQPIGNVRSVRNMAGLDRGSFLQSGPLGIDFGTSSDPATTQTPRRLRLSFKGIVPRADGVPLFALLSWGVGAINLSTRYDSDQIQCAIDRGSNGEEFYSTVQRKPGEEQLLEVEWRDMPGAAGGTIGFFIDGKPAGGPFRTKVKPRIAPETTFCVNALIGNSRQAVDGMLVRELRIAIDQPVTDYAYQPVVSGPVAGSALPELVVDARATAAPQPFRTLAWRGPDGGVATLDVTIGPLDVAPGQAYKAVLEDWSTGKPVTHPNALVMTRIAAQNCRFEDDWLTAAQPAWIECLPQGPVPNIAGIDYRCEAIRCGDYVQFQFGYDWDAATMPANPFGDPSGRHSYMIPHKWRIYDSEDLPIGVVETPDGGPLNGKDKPHLFAGPNDGRNCAIISKADRWYPHGTVRSGVIWRSGDPGSHDQAGVRRAVPLFDLSVPFGCHLDYSMNGFDLRIFSGGQGDGQANGFGNIRVIPWKQSDYRKMVDNAYRTRDPFQGSLYSPNSMAANAGLWLEYSPFNVQGRSPITGSGGIRDDRQIIAEPVAWYMNLPGGARPHDGTPWRAIALDYLTGYVSDPVHAFENGRNVPLFKGNARRGIVARNHYYGPGNLNIPESRAWYQQGGRVAGGWVQGTGPLRVSVPYAGDTPSTPYFGTFQIDKAHGHQFPGWGSLLFRTPEFAFLGHRFWDQNRLYSNDIVGDPWLALWATRDGAWAFLHTALAWKTASAGSQRLYSRAEVLDFALSDFELFHDQHYASIPGFLHPPSNVMPNGKVETRLAAYAAAQYFGVVAHDDNQVFQHEFMLGYWLSALAAGEKMGFNDALRRASPKAKAVLDWMIAMHRKRVVGRLLEGANLPPLPGSDYLLGLWTAEHIRQADGEVARLPRRYAELERLWGRQRNWDGFDDHGKDVSRDGQTMDQLISGPSLLRYLLGQIGDDIVAAQTIANGWREQKKREEMAKGDQAGTGWFRYLQATNNPARPVQS